MYFGAVFVMSEKVLYVITTFFSSSVKEKNSCLLKESFNVIQCVLQRQKQSLSWKFTLH